jgi:putative ABC transport system ATP-binding protein
VNAMAETAMRLEDVTKTYGDGAAAVRAVDSVSLEVAQGELALVQGPSGSGKTTLLAMCGALLRPSSGRVWLGDTEVTGRSERELPEVRLRHVGFIFQSANLLTNLTALENVRVVMEAAGARGADERARALLDELQLGPRLKMLPEKLSGGERQRVAIARALANDPPVLLADEPTANLDSKAGYQLMHTLEVMAKERGKTVMAVTHDRRIEDVADRVLWLEDGRLSDRPPEEAGHVTDPVCEMRIDPARAAGRREHANATYFFCSDICLGRFDADPDRYAREEASR